MAAVRRRPATITTRTMADGSAPLRAGGRFHLLQEFSGACGDLGTFIPHAIGAMMVAGRFRAAASG